MKVLIAILLAAILAVLCIIAHALISPRPAEATVTVTTATESSCADVIYDAWRIESFTALFDETRLLVPKPEELSAAIDNFKADVKKHPVLADLNGPQQDLAVNCKMVVVYALAFDIDCNQCMSRGLPADYKNARDHSNSLTNQCEKLIRQLGQLR